MRQLTVHIVEPDSHARAEHARVVLMLGRNAQVYRNLDELLDHPPEGGAILMRQHAKNNLADLFQRLGENGVCTPVIVVDHEAHSEAIVAALHGGAHDFLDLPLEPGRLARSLSRVIAEAEALARAHDRKLMARRRLQGLTRRELQVLELVSAGSSNKVAARALGISPRTAEIHRANMMHKIGASNVAEAIRLWLQADLEGADSKDGAADETKQYDAGEQRDTGSISAWST